MRNFHLTCLTLVIIGALNWGLWGLFQFDLVAAIFGGPTGTFSRIIYSLVGLAGLSLIFTTSQLQTRRLDHSDRDRDRLRRAA